MAEVLVYVDHVDGAVRKPTLELLTLARRIGEPVAVHLGPGADTAAPVLAEHGATRVLTADAAEFSDYLVVPKVDALEAAAKAVQPAAVLVPSSAEGKEVAARLALRLGSGVIAAWNQLPEETRVRVLQEARLAWDREYHVSRLPERLEGIIRRGAR